MPGLRLTLRLLQPFFNFIAPGGGVNNGLLLEDNTSFILLEDNTSVILLE
jgi:hypothetical protein